MGYTDICDKWINYSSPPVKTSCCITLKGSKAIQILSIMQGITQQQINSELQAM